MPHPRFYRIKIFILQPRPTQYHHITAFDVVHTYGKNHFLWRGSRRYSRVVERACWEPHGRDRRKLIEETIPSPEVTPLNPAMLTKYIYPEIQGRNPFQKWVTTMCVYYCENKKTNLWDFDWDMALSRYSRLSVGPHSGNSRMRFLSMRSFVISMELFPLSTQ